MQVCIAPKIVLRVSTVLVLSVSLANALALGQPHVGNREHAFVNQETARHVDDQPLSPRLKALQERLKSGDRSALDSFWTEIRQHGAPMIEPADNDREMLVTMLWRTREETKNVFVFRLGEVNKPMVRLLDTDLWYKTFRLQKGARFIYQLATNLPDPTTWQGIVRFASVTRNDPLNPFQFTERNNEFNPYEVNS